MRLRETVVASTLVIITFAVVLGACRGSDDDRQETSVSAKATVSPNSTKGQIDDKAPNGADTTGLSLRALRRRFDVGVANAGRWDQLVPRQYRPCANAGPETNGRVIVRQLRRDGRRVGYAVSAAPGASPTVIIRDAFAACAGGVPDPMGDSGIRSWTTACGGNGEIVGRWNNRVIPSPRVVVVSIGTGC